MDDTPLHLTAKIELENEDGTWKLYESVRIGRDQVCLTPTTSTYCTYELN